MNLEPLLKAAALAEARGSELTMTVAEVRELAAEFATLASEIMKLKQRYTWAANELLACDYGDNDHPSKVVGWHVYGWRYRQDRIDRRIYGDSIDMAIDLELHKTAESQKSGGVER